MASQKCCKPAQESCQSKCHDNSFRNKVSEMAGKLFHWNHQGHHASGNGHGRIDGHGLINGHHHPEHTLIKTQSSSETLTYYTDHTVAKILGSHTLAQSHGHNNAVGHSHGLHIGQHSSHGLAFHGEKKRNEGEHKNGNESCSDGDSSDTESDCD